MLACVSLKDDYVVLIIIFTILILSNIGLSKFEPRACAVCVFKCVCVTGNDYRFDSHQFNSSLIKTKAPEMTAINTVFSVSVYVCRPRS